MREFCAVFNMPATRQTGIRRRAKRRISLRFTVPIKDNSLSRVIIRLFFFAEPFRVKKSSKLFSVFTIFNTDSTVVMAPKAKHVASSSKDVALETQMGGSSMQEAPIYGSTTI